MGEVDKMSIEVEQRKFRKLIVTVLSGLAVCCLVLTIVLAGAVYYIYSFRHLGQTVQIMQDEWLQKWSTINIHDAPLNDDDAVNVKIDKHYNLPRRREVVSSGDPTLQGIKDVLNSVNGRSNTVNSTSTITHHSFSFLPAIITIVNSTVKEFLQKELSKISTGTPSNGGAVYTRWGKKNCSDTATLIYTGLAAGPDYRSTDGGSNLLCLPTDAEYDSELNWGYFFDMRIGKAIYAGTAMLHVPGGQSMRNRQVPCAVCAAKQRLTKIMMPGKVRCPTDDWTVEYQGALVAQHKEGMRKDSSEYTSQTRINYECLDRQPEGFTDTMMPTPVSGVLLSVVGTQCSGAQGVEYCPPYDYNKIIPCIVCSI